jgi:hypothetical protein
MRPHVLLIGQMMPEVEAQLDDAYCRHRLFAAHDRAAWSPESAPRCASRLHCSADE